jgi:GxxExxY protein
MPIAALSTLPPETEALMERTIGCTLTVHRRLGCGFQEKIYSKALGIELEANAIDFEREREIWIEYRGQPIGAGRVDLIVGGRLVVEIKAASALDPLFTAQLVSYLRATRLRAGLLLNFNSALLKYGIKRVVL